ncbi:hypothetical protein BpHYR1_033865 [Brachionus plicatilis]|uniref:Uncharacterized protein n=1 Tax=Brachionus plicatilis TaxID=10195 RepID=A0A3M7RV32_BRAPC|nr:hypothetical protein BpHYR1_033865 [Brachionus plicatilis]
MRKENSIQEIIEYNSKLTEPCNNKRRYNCNIIASIKTKTTRLNEFQQKTIVVDRFHFQKHSQDDYFCKENTNADKFSELNEINTSVCEEINFWLSGYKHMENGEAV